MFRHMGAGYADIGAAAGPDPDYREVGGGGGGGQGDCLGQWLGAGWAGMGDGACGQCPAGGAGGGGHGAGPDRPSPPCAAGSLGWVAPGSSAAWVAPLTSLVLSEAPPAPAAAGGVGRGGVTPCPLPAVAGHQRIRWPVDVVGAGRAVLGGHEDGGVRLDAVLVDGPTVGGVDQPTDRLAVDGLLVEQGPGHGVETAPVAGQHLEGPLLLGPEDDLHLVVDDLAGVLGVVPGVHEVLAQEHLAL